VTIIRHGKTVETGTLADMRHLTTVSVEAELRAPASLDGMPGWLSPGRWCAAG
jgi:ABC-2 type transport system ATP-binding protein